MLKYFLLSAVGTFCSLVICCSQAKAAALGGELPNPAFTPCANDPAVVRIVTKEELCSTKTSTIRNVTATEKKLVFMEYGLPYNDKSVCAKGYEVDHCCSLELGCNNDIHNLWPQSYCGQILGFDANGDPILDKWNATTKDKLENELHREICSGRITIQAAQKCISTNWIECYKETFREEE